MRILYVLVFVLGTCSMYGSETCDSTRWSIGVSYAYGVNSLGSVWTYNYNYNPTLYELSINYELRSKGAFRWALVAHPQYNHVSINEGERIAYEYGLNLGVALFIGQSWARPYIQLTAGPHYISDSIERQAAGFIFSDNLELGILFRLPAQYFLAPNAGFRHLSNASLKSPNDGINNFIFGLTIGRRI